LFKAAINFFKVVNMSVIIAGQGGRVQLEQSDMPLVLKMAKMAKGGISCVTVEETQYLIKKPRVEDQEQKTWGVELPRNDELKAARVRHPAMRRQNPTFNSS
jgi:hypothetical protein